MKSLLVWLTREAFQHWQIGTNSWIQNCLNRINNKDNNSKCLSYYRLIFYFLMPNYNSVNWIIELSDYIEAIKNSLNIMWCWVMLGNVRDNRNYQLSWMWNVVWHKGWAFTPCQTKPRNQRSINGKKQKYLALRNTAIRNCIKHKSISDRLNWAK